MKRVNSEVAFADNASVTLRRDDVAALKQLAPTTPRGRTRLCAHTEGSDPLHEMLIVLERRTYIRPHKHSGKSESFHIVEGVVDVVVLDDLGEIQEVIPMGDYASGRAFYWRHSDARYHTLLIRSERLVIHETTNGPFRADSTFAPWSPEESNKSGAQEFVSGLSRRVEEFLSQSEGRRRGSNT